VKIGDPSDRNVARLSASRVHRLETLLVGLIAAFIGCGRSWIGQRVNSGTTAGYSGITTG